MPSFPAFLLLLAAIPLLVPAFSWSRRVLPDPVPALPTRRAGRRVLAVAAVVLVVLPLIFVAGTTPQSTAEAVSYPFQDVYVPVRDFGLKVANVGGRQVLTWKRPYSGKTAVFYTILRSRPVAPDPSSNGDRKAIDGLACRDRQHGAPLNCLLYMDRLERAAGAVHRPGASGPLDVPRRHDRELEERPLARRHHDRQQAGDGERPGMSVRLTVVYRLAAAGGWLAFVWATTHWYSWQQTIDLLFGSDAQEYETIAKAAPGFPDEALPSQHANRFVPHYLVGLVSDALHVGDRRLYYVFAFLLLLAILLVLDRLLRPFRLGRIEWALCVGALITNPYLYRFLALAPGRLADSVFIIGGALALLGLLRANPWLLVGGLVVATLGRSESVFSLAVLAPIGVLVSPDWRPLAPARRWVSAAAALLIPLGVYGLIVIADDSFSRRDHPGFWGLTIFGDLRDLPRQRGHDRAPRLAGRDRGGGCSGADRRRAPRPMAWGSTREAAVRVLGLARRRYRRLRRGADPQPRVHPRQLAAPLRPRRRLLRRRRRRSPPGLGAERARRRGRDRRPRGRLAPPPFQHDQPGVDAGSLRRARRDRRGRRCDRGRDRRAPPRGLASFAKLLLEQGEPLCEHGVLVVELRDHRRVVEQHEQDEQRADREQHRGRIVSIPTQPAIVFSPSPERQREQHDAGEQPEQRVALAEPARADQLQHDQDQHHRGDRGDDGDDERSHFVSSSGVTFLRNSPTNRASITLTM